MCELGNSGLVVPYHYLIFHLRPTFLAIRHNWRVTEKCNCGCDKGRNFASVIPDFIIKAMHEAADSMNVRVFENLNSNRIWAPRVNSMRESRRLAYESCPNNPTLAIVNNGPSPYRKTTRTAKVRALDDNGEGRKTWTLWVAHKIISVIDRSWSGRNDAEDKIGHGLLNFVLSVAPESKIACRSLCFYVYAHFSRGNKIG